MNTTYTYIFSKLLAKTDFDYIEKYNDIVIENPHFTIFSYPPNIREIWYKFVPSLIRSYPNFAKKYGYKQLSDDLLKDENLLFIPIELVDREALKTQYFGKLLTDDYNFKQADELGKRYFKFYDIVRYSAGVLSENPEINVDFYLRTEAVVPETESYKSILSIDGIGKVLSQNVLFTLFRRHRRIIGGDYDFLERFYNPKERKFNIQIPSEIEEAANLAVLSKHSTLPVNFIRTENILKYLVSHATHDTLEYWTVPQNNHDTMFEKYANRNQLVNFVNMDILINCGEKLFTRYFYVNNLEQMEYMLTHCEDKKTIKELLEKFVVSSKRNNDIFKSPVFLDAMISINMEMLENADAGFVIEVCSHISNPKDLLVNWYSQFIEDYFESMIRRRVVNRENFKSMFQEWMIETQEIRSIMNKLNDFKIKQNSTLPFTWIETYHSEPPIEIYLSPNHNVGFTNMTNIWRLHVNKDTVPMEMTSIKYWQYMIKAQGKKKNPNFTMCYSFFSNTEMNKLIFCKSDIELLEPARERLFIPVDYQKLKEFLHEDMPTTDICLFGHMTKDDFNKVAGGNDSLDMVVFQDMKNIYRERTPLKDIIKYIKESVELKFEVECDTLN